MKKITAKMVINLIEIIDDLVKTHGLNDDDPLTDQARKEVEEVREIVSVRKKEKEKNQ